MPWTEEEIYYKKKIPNFFLLENTKFVNRRIQHEIISIQKCIDNDIKQEKGVKFNNIEPYFINFEIKPDNIIIFNILFKNKYILSFNLSFKSEYPFKPPECTIKGNNDYEYKILLARISEHYYKKINEFKNNNKSNKKKEETTKDETKNEETNEEETNEIKEEETNEEETNEIKEEETTKKTQTGCLCCDTIVCRNNWYPGINLSTLIEEINTNTTYMYDIVYKMLENKVYEKHLGYKI
jgi:ubiquitin-protein ligase